LNKITSLKFTGTNFCLAD